MVTNIKSSIDKEFKANDIDIQAKIIEYAWQNNAVSMYEIILLYAGARQVMKIYCNAQYPFKPKVLPVNSIEPHKLIRLCEIVMEAFNEVERNLKG